MVVKSASRIPQDTSPVKKRSSFATPSPTIAKKRSSYRKKTNTMQLKPSKSGDSIAI